MFWAFRPLGDEGRGQSSGEVPEDRPHGLRLFLVDGPLAPDGIAGGIHFPDDVIAIAEATAGAARANAALEAAMGLQGKILEEESVHRALEAHMQFPDLAFRQGDQADLGKAQLLEQARHVLLISRKAIQGLRHDDLEQAGPRILQQFLVSPASTAMRR